MTMRLCSNVAFNLQSLEGQLIMLCTDFRNFSRRPGIWNYNFDRIRIWIHLMTGHYIDRKQVARHFQMLSRWGICCSHKCDPRQCRCCIVTQLRDRVQESAERFNPESSLDPLAPEIITSINRQIAEFSHVIEHIKPASGSPGHGSGAADQLTKKTVQQIQICTSKLIEAVAQAPLTPSTETEDAQQIRICTSKLIDMVAQITNRPSVRSEDDRKIQDCIFNLTEAVAQATIRRSTESKNLRAALSDRLTRLQEISETLTIERPSSKCHDASCELSPPTVCQTVRAASPGLNQLLRVGDEPRNRIMIQRLVTTSTGAKNGRDHKDRNDSLMKQQGPWMSAKVDKRYGPNLRLEFDDVDALKQFKERATKQTLKSITRIELEYDPSPGDLTPDAVIQTINTTFPTLRTLRTSVLPVRRWATDFRVWGQHAAVLKEGNSQWWMDREVAYFMALENVTAHVCLSFRWKSDADWFARDYPERDKWKSPSSIEGYEEFGEWVFERGL